MWNFFLSFFYEAALEVSVSSVLAYQLMTEVQGFEETAITPELQSVYRFNRFCFYFMTILALVSFLTMCFILLQTRKTMRRWEPNVGFIYSGLKYSSKRDTKCARLLPFYFVVKRVIFCFVVFNLNSEMLMGLITQLLTIISLIILTVGKPYLEAIDGKIDLGNEIFIYIFMNIIVAFREPNRVEQETEVVEGAEERILKGGGGGGFDSTVKTH